MGMRSLTPMLRTLAVVAIGHAAAHPVRTLLTAVGVALGVAAPIAIDGANRDVLQTFRAGVLQVAGPATLEVAAGDRGLDETVIRSVRRHPAVRSALPVVQRLARDIATGSAVTVIGTDLLEVASVKPIRWSAESAAAGVEGVLEDRLYLGRRLADRWGVAPGVTRSLDMGGHARSLPIGGVIEPDDEGASFWDEVLLVDIAPAQELFDSVGFVDRIDVVTMPDVSIDVVQQELAAQVPPGVTVRRPAQRGEQLEALVSAFRLNLVMLSAVGLLVGGFLIYNTLSFSVAQRRREIGMLRAIGLSERGVLALFLAEGIGYGMVGGAIGSVAGLLLSQALVTIVGRTVGDLYAAVGTAAGSVWTVARVSTMVGQGAVLGVAVALLGAWVPSREASRTSVVGALAPGGYEPGAGLNVARQAWIVTGLLVASAAVALAPSPEGLPLFGYFSVLLLLLGLSAVAPVCVASIGLVRALAARGRTTGDVSLAALAADAAARAPRRNGITVSSLLVGVAIMIGVLVMIHSFRQTVELWIDQTVMAELIVTPEGWLHGSVDSRTQRLFPRAYADRVATVPGVEAVDTYRHLAVELSGRPRAVIARDLRLHATYSRYLFVRGDSREILERAAAQRGVIVAEVLATALGLREGAELELATPMGTQRFPVAGIFYDYATDGGKIVMDRALFAELWHDDAATVLPVYLRKGADAQATVRAIEAALASLDASARPVAVMSNRELRREILLIFDRTFRVTYVLEVIALVIALFGTINTLLTAALERRRELATLHAIGASARQIARLLLWEAGYLGAVGGLLGLVGGLWLAAVLVWVINKQSFGWTIPLSIPWGLLVIVPVLAIVTALAAAYVPARWIARQPVADGLRYE